MAQSTSIQHSTEHGLQSTKQHAELMDLFGSLGWCPTAFNPPGTTGLLPQTQVAQKVHGKVPTSHNCDMMHTKGGLVTTASSLAATCLASLIALICQSHSAHISRPETLALLGLPSRTSCQFPSYSPCKHHAEKCTLPLQLAEADLHRTPCFN